MKPAWLAEMRTFSVVPTIQAEHWMQPFTPDRILALIALAEAALDLAEVGCVHACNCGDKGNCQSCRFQKAKAALEETP